MWYPLPAMFPLIAQLDDGNMVMCSSCDCGNFLECSVREDRDSFLCGIAANLSNSEQASRVRIFKKPVRDINIGVSDPVSALCYVGEISEDRQSIEWSCHWPNMEKPEPEAKNYE